MPTANPIAVRSPCRLRNLLQRVFDLLIGRGLEGQIAEGDDADQPVLIQNRQPPDLLA